MSKENTPVTAVVSGTTILIKGKDCKHSVVFDTTEANSAITNVYVSRKLPGINDAKSVRVTIEIIG